jgi:hypothetical protein
MGEGARYGAVASGEKEEGIFTTETQSEQNGKSKIGSIFGCSGGFLVPRTPLERNDGFG